MLPEAWNLEHNQLHHYALGEDTDPDLVERNLEWLRESDVSTPMKYALVIFTAFTWKWLYYAPNTFKELKCRQAKRAGKHVDDNLKDIVTLPGLIIGAPLVNTPESEGFVHPEWLAGSDYLINVMMPYFVYRFLIFPLPWLALGTWTGSGSAMYWNSVLTMVLADVLTNAHSFLIVVTNHAGNDLYRFSSHCRPKSGEFFVRQVISSVNFAAGDDITDFAHGWLNYQIEHHLWPDLSMLSYQKAMPEVKEICKKYNVPYIQESVFTRLRKTVDIM